MQQQDGSAARAGGGIRVRRIVISDVHNKRRLRGGEGAGTGTGTRLGSTGTMKERKVGEGETGPMGEFPTQVAKQVRRGSGRRRSQQVGNKGHRGK